MAVPASLRALLGSLAPSLDDASVAELIISAPYRAFLVRGAHTAPVDVPELSESRIRSIAERLYRLLPQGYGLIDDEIEARVVGDPRQPQLPVVRLGRIACPTEDLQDLVGRGVLSEEFASTLCAAGEGGSTIVVAGRHHSGKSSLVAALAHALSATLKVAVLDQPWSPIARSGVGHFVLPVEGGLESALLLGADLIVADSPSPTLLRQLLIGGRPFIASIEAEDAMASVSRLVARVLAADESISRPAAEALTESGIDVVVEMTQSGAQGLHVGALLEPCRERGTLIARPLLSGRLRSRSGASLGAAVPMPPAGLGAAVPVRDAGARRSSLQKAPAQSRKAPVESFVEAEPSAQSNGGAVVASNAQVSALDPTSIRSIEESSPPPESMRVRPASDLGLPAAINPEVRPDSFLDSQSDIFPARNMSEIRPEQLVSKSFVMHVDSLGLPPSSVALLEHRASASFDDVASSVDLNGVDDGVAGADARVQPELLERATTLVGAVAKEVVLPNAEGVRAILESISGAQSDISSEETADGETSEPVKRIERKELEARRRRSRP